MSHSLRFALSAILCVSLHIRVMHRKPKASHPHKLIYKPKKRSKRPTSKAPIHQQRVVFWTAMCKAVLKNSNAAEVEIYPQVRSLRTLKPKQHQKVEGFQVPCQGPHPSSFEASLNFGHLTRSPRSCPSASRWVRRGPHNVLYLRPKTPCPMWAIPAVP